MLKRDFIIVNIICIHPDFVEITHIINMSWKIRIPSHTHKTYTSLHAKHGRQPTTGEISFCLSVWLLFAMAHIIIFGAVHFDIFLLESRWLHKPEHYGPGTNTEDWWSYSHPVGKFILLEFINMRVVTKLCC